MEAQEARLALRRLDDILAISRDNGTIDKAIAPLALARLRLYEVSNYRLAERLRAAIDSLEQLGLKPIEPEDVLERRDEAVLLIEQAVLLLSATGDPATEFLAKHGEAIKRAPVPPQRLEREAQAVADMRPSPSPVMALETT